MEPITNLVKQIFETLLGYLIADGPILLGGILIASFLTVYMDPIKLKAFFMRKTGLSIPSAILFGSLTPLCACGTTAVMLSMFVSALPWGPVMAFMVSSPLTSPSEYLFETAFLGSKFANGMLISSLGMGLLAGITAHLLHVKSRFFEGQFRISSQPTFHQPEIFTLQTVGLHKQFQHKAKFKRFLFELYNTGVKKILFYFMIFIAIGKMVELIIPKEWILTLLSDEQSLSVPFAALVGLPLYLTDASALPLMKSLISSGASEGAILAFLVAGKATGVPVIAGMATLMRKKALAFYVTFVLASAMVAGWIYQIIF